MKKNIQTENLILHGISAGTGIVYADVCFFSQPESYTFECSINEEGIENELNRYRRALISCKDDLLLLQKRFEKDGTMIGSQILELQLAMLSDPLMNELMEEKIRKLKKNTETVFRLFIQDYKRKFQKIKDPVFVDRIKDIVDVSDRIIRHLNPYSRKKNLQIKKNTILIAEDLLPSDLAEIGAENILGIITNKGGFTSHIAIIARAKGIPYVTNIDVRLLKELGISKVIIDGKVGKVIVNPSPDVIQQYSI
ncbi:MAG TPA: PEP-utilizing enzyme, partial [Chlamydiales bacterium]|nr:PEP-utilizing enzyme [Chlamydiales bacterium]